MTGYSFGLHTADYGEIITAIKNIQNFFDFQFALIVGLFALNPQNIKSRSDVNSATTRSIYNTEFKHKTLHAKPACNLLPRHVSSNYVRASAPRIPYVTLHYIPRIVQDNFHCSFTEYLTKIFLGNRFSKRWHMKVDFYCSVLMYIQHDHVCIPASKS
jgi:hypothetical protein